MSDPENFLARWSRRKRQAEDPAPPAASEAPPPQADAPDPRPGHDQRQVRGKAAPAKPAPAFDPASLPSLDSISAGTDMRAFLAPGVPPELTRAALRRAWAADPAIRDFVGLQEYDWDFHDPSGIPGFRDIVESDDVQKIMRQVFGEATEDAPEPDRPAPDAPSVPPAAESIAQAPPAAADPSGDTGRLDAPGQQYTQLRLTDETASSDIVQRESNVATQDRKSEDQSPLPKSPRRHGGALPQ